MSQLNKYQKEIESLLNKHDKELSKNLYTAYTGVLRDLKQGVKQRMQNYEELSYSQIMSLNHDVSLMLQIEEQLDILSGVQQDHVYHFLGQTGEIAYNDLFYQFDQTSDYRANFTMLPADTIQTIIQTPVAGLRLSERLNDGLVADLRRGFRETLTMGFANGWSYQKMAKHLSELAGSSYKRAMNIARTEGGRVSSLTRQMSQQDAKELGIDTQKQWVSTLDMKTRDSHARLDGQVKEVDEYFKIDGHEALQPHMFGIAREDINCRCRTILIIKGYEPALRRDNITKEEMDYKNYQDWFDSHFDKQAADFYDMINLKMGAINMAQMVGDANYSNFINHLAGVSDEDIKQLFLDYGDQISFNKLKNGRAYASGSTVQLDQEDFDGGRGHTPFEVVYHEIGHAFDSLGISSIAGSGSAPTGKKVKHKVLGRTIELDELIYHASGLPEYKLKEKINRDLWKFVNGDLPMLEDIGPKPRKKAEKAAWEEEWDRIYDLSKENFANFKAEYKTLSSKNPYLASALSDMVESTRFVGDYPFGWGHGSKYWSKPGMAETEFFAHMTESLAANPESFELLSKIFPTSTDTWRQIVKDMIKGR